jgi:hypothetical protein
MSSGLVQLGRASCGAVAVLVPLGARARALAWSTLFLAAACAPDAGRAVVTFRFSEPPTLAVDGEPVDTVLTLRVEERAEVTRFLGASAPRLLPAGSREEDIVLPGIQIPHGDHRVVVMELTLTGGEILYYGESAPFSLHAGDVITVPIALAPRARPALQVEVLGAVEGRVPSSDIEVRVTAPGARRVELSNLSSFEGATAQDVSPDGILAWDLDRGLRGACVEDDACPRKLSVRVRDDHDVPSTIVEVALVVDTRRPAIQPQTLSVLLPSGEPWLSTPTALAAGATATITFAVTERLGAPPVLLGEPLERTPCVVEGLVVRCAARAPTVPSPGMVPLGVRLVDLVGHEAVLPLTDLELAPGAPPPPDTTRVVLERAPWGRGASAEPYYVVRGEAGAATPGSRVVAFPGAATTNVVELARTATVVDALGRFALVLPALADSQAYVGLVLVSAAGQPSDAMLTQPGVQATLTTRGRVSMRVADPRAPVSVERVPSVGPQLVQTPRVVVDRSALSQVDGQVLVADANAWWQPYLKVTESPPALQQVSMVFDRRRGIWVLFGGLSDTADSSELWEYDGRRWLRRGPTGAEPHWPPARRGHAMVFDSRRGATVVVGGETSAGLLGDAWAWDGETWSELAAPPEPRVALAMAYDRPRGEVVAFGGYVAGRMVAGDTWVLRDDRWVVFESAEPVARARAAMAFDEATTTILMFGGQTEQGPQAELWSWSGAHARWSRVEPTDRTRPRPPSRLSAGWVFAPSLEGMLLFGGLVSSTAPATPAREDSWRWRGGEWTRLPDDAATLRAEAAVSEASHAGVILMYGGRRALSGQALADMWRLSASTWVREDSDLRWPPALQHAASIEDTRSGSWLICGGLGRDGSWSRATWHWDGRVWTAAEHIPPLQWPSLAWDEARQVLVLVGQEPTSRELVVYERRSGTWVGPLGQLEQGFFDGQTAYVPDLGGTVVVGAADSASLEPVTRLWSGSWAPVTGGTGLTPRVGFGVAWVPPARELWLLGGVGPMGLHDSTIWALGGTGWSPRVTSGPQPPPRADHALVWDRRRDDVLLVGGDADVWTVGTTTVPWARLAVEGSIPTPRQAAAISAAGATLWMFGGTDNINSPLPRPVDELWSLERPRAQRVGIAISAVWAQLGVEAGTVSGVVAAVHGGPLDGPRPAHARVYAWDELRGEWSVVDELSPGIATEIELSGARETNLLVVPTSTASAPGVQLDAVELRLSYVVRP